MTIKTLAVAIIAWLGASPLLAWSPTWEAQKTLVGGHAWAEVLADTDGAALIRAAVDIAAPPSTVWAVMTDCALTKRFITNVVSCTVLQGDQRSGWDVRDQFSRGNMFLPDIHNVVRSEYHPCTHIRFKRAGGNLEIDVVLAFLGRMHLEMTGLVDREVSFTPIADAVGFDGVLDLPLLHQLRLSDLRHGR